jgi:starch phosphorylase
LQTFQVFPAIPEKISFLGVLARNLWWCWHVNAIELFRRIQPKLWSQSGRNPLVFLTMIPQKRFVELSKDDSFIAHLENVKKEFEKEIYAQFILSDSPYKSNEKIAYFSMEFGIHESLPLFAGGLGVLAGDHLKAASDMGLPLVGVGLLYRQGYFRQYLDQSGWQQEEYPETDIFFLPLKRARDKNDNEIKISITGPDGDIRAVVWQVNVGRVPLFLLDTNISENQPEIRDITSNLYVSDAKKRLAQEVLLGVGGIRALQAIDIIPSVCHMNEGHSSFSSIERLAQVMSIQQVDLKTAMEIVPRTTVFTTHTPVAAGHDEFPPEMLKPFMLPFQEKLNTKVDEIISWGQPVGSGSQRPLSMFILGLRMSQYHNGVS